MSNINRNIYSSNVLYSTRNLNYMCYLGVAKIFIKNHNIFELARVQRGCQSDQTVLCITNFHDVTLYDTDDDTGMLSVQAVSFVWKNRFRASTFSLDPGYYLACRLPRFLHHLYVRGHTLPSAIHKCHCDSERFQILRWSIGEVKILSVLRTFLIKTQLFLLDYCNQKGLIE